MKIIKLNRRNFLKSSLSTGSGLLLGISGLPYIGNSVEELSMNPYLKIDPEGKIYIGVPSSEMGQGIHTTLAMLIAEELEVDMEQIAHIETIHHSDFKHPLFARITKNVLNLQVTGASHSIQDWNHTYRKIGATARELLRMAAAQKWSLPLEKCIAKKGRVNNLVNSYSLGYGELTYNASLLETPKNPTLKTPEEYRLLGKPIKRWETSKKINGTAIFGTDVNLPGLLYGTVKHCPVFGDTIKYVDDSATRGVQGVIEVIALKDHAVIVADSTWTAMKGAEVLKLKSKGGDPFINDKNISQILRDDLDKKGVPASHIGNPSDAIKKANQILELEYEAPIQAHAAMEPMCATANVAHDSCQIWIPTQAQDLVMNVAMAVTKLPAERINVHTTYLGGGFGRKVEWDSIAAPIIASKATRRPVKIIWTREEDMQHDFYRPPALIRMNLGLNEQKISAFNIKISTPSQWLHFAEGLGVYFPPMINKKGYDYASVVGLFDPFALKNGYAIPNIHVELVPSKINIPIGFWRAIGASYNIFAIEGAIDEAAITLNLDPYKFRLGMLKNNSRAIAVLKQAAKLSKWGNPPDGRYHGISFAYFLDTFQAQVVEISISKRGKIKIHRVTCVADCGQVFNSHIAKQQLEGGIIYGLTATLKKEINIKNGKVVQSNFDDYRMLRIKEIPEIKIDLIKNHNPPGGLGEAGTPLIGPAVANAVFAATGKRIRRLPILSKDLI